MTNLPILMLLVPSNRVVALVPGGSLVWSNVEAIKRVELRAATTDDLRAALGPPDGEEPREASS